MYPIHYEQNVTKVIVDSFKGFEKYLNQLDKLGTYYFRGQGNAHWPIASPYKRLFDLCNSVKIDYPKENEIIEGFDSIGIKIEDLISEEDDLKIDLYKLAILQHYGTATRLVDFTRNPYIALYFGARDLISNSQGVHNFSIYAIKQNLIKDKFEPLELDHGVHQKHIEEYPAGYSIHLFQPESVGVLDAFSRLKSQEGLFLYASNPLANVHDELIIEHNWKIIHQMFSLKDAYFIKFEFWLHKPTLKNLFNSLGERGIIEDRLFPDLEGKARGLNFKHLYV